MIIKDIRLKKIGTRYMDGQNNENLKELFEEFLEDGPVNEAIKDMVDFMINEIPTVSPGELETKEKKIKELEAELEKLKEEKTEE